MPDQEENCKVCSKLIDETTTAVKCNKCNAIYHRSCVVANDNVEVWKCPSCVSSELQVPPPPKSKSRRSASSAKAIALMEERAKILTDQENLLKEEESYRLMQTQEEEKLFNELMEKRDLRTKQIEASFQKRKKILEEKQKMVEETMLSIASSSSGSVKSAGCSKKRTEEWVKNKDNHPTSPPEKDDDIVPVVEVEKQIISSAIAGVSKGLEKPEEHTFRVGRMINSTTFKPNIAPKAFHAELNRKELTKDHIAARHIVGPLPSFDGNCRTWKGFVSALERSTKMCNFSNDENLERLRESLSGHAFVAAEHYLDSGGLVAEIVEDLRNLFGRSEFIISELLIKLRKEPSPQIDDIDSIIRFSLQVNSICSTMCSAQLSEHLWDPNLLQEMEKKLPPSMKLEWASYKHQSPVKCNVESFASWIKQKADSYVCILAKPPNLSMSNKSKSKCSMNLHDESVKRCYGCNKADSHLLQDCEAFRNKSYSEKWRILKTNHICRICLLKHKSKRCKVDGVCGVDGCQYLHHKVMHKPNVVDQQDVHIHSSTATAHFKIIPVVVENNGTSIETYAMLDDGSSITIIDKQLADELQLMGDNEPLCLKWTTGINKRDDSSQRVSLKIKSTDPHAKFFTLSGVRTLKNSMLPSQTIDFAKLSQDYKYLQGVPIKSYQNITPKILIGNDHSKLSMVSKYKYGGDKDPIACKTKLGWTISGSSQSHEGFSFHISRCPCCKAEANSADGVLEDLVRNHYKLENIGIDSRSGSQMSTEEQKAIEILERSIERIDNQYEVGLLWRFENAKIPKSYQMAKRRLMCLEKRYKDDPELLKVVDTQINEYVQKGYAAKLCAADVKALGDDCWYLPMFVVRNPNKPSKIRLVWDAAAEVNGISLNKLLYKGPDLLANLAGVLIRFREYKIGIAGDIREMFHQVRIKESDQKYQLFLWRSSPESDPSVYKMRVMTFGATCSPSCAQYVMTSSAKRFIMEKPKAVEAICKNHYVDDWLQSIQDEKQAISLAKEVREIHNQGGFEIRNWVSNSLEFVRELNGSKADDNTKSMELASKYEKVLGLYWRTADDNFIFQMKHPLNCADVLKNSMKPTKRQVLRVLMSVFDPLGLISHIMIYPKILIQMVWRSGINWDSEINDDHYDLWQVWIKSLEEIENLKIPRWIGLGTPNQGIQLHVFVDAGEDGFAAAAYVRIKSSDGVHCNLVSAKSKVSPLKVLSIPRLELQAAVIGVRLAKFINDSLSYPIEELFYWTDSRTVLSWINSDLKRYEQFVACRVSEIHDLSSPSQWNWVGSRDNVADLATKLKIHDHQTSIIWYHGPKFLYESDELWKHHKAEVEPTTQEIRPQYEAPLNFHSVAAPIRFSNWEKLLRSMAFAIRFGNNLLNKIRKLPITRGILSQAELGKAENMLYAQAQAEGFPDEYATLEQKHSHVSKSSPIYKDMPFMDDDQVIRANSRLEFASICEVFKKPIPLPKDHQITDLIVRHYHNLYHHINHETVINEIRQRYVIQCLRTKLKSIRSRCQYCKNKSAQPNVPEMSPLPPARLGSFTQPFSFTGIDYFGPMYVSVLRRREKRWMLLLTCLTTRAVHVEVANSLTTSSCIICLRNFICRRGTPRQLYSDNGTSFKGASNELRQAILKIDQQELASKFISSETEWIFIPPASPHMGGAWERMVRSIKTTLKAILPEGSISEEVLRNLLCEAENIVNSRPLTYVPIESENEPALTPNHFLLGSSCGVKPFGILSDDRNHLKDNWHKAQHLSNAFWRRWTKEYMPTLSRRTKWFQTGKELQKDDIVIIVGEDKRGKWPKGRVLELVRSRDNRVRSAKIQTDTGIYERPVSKIAVLDIASDSTPEDNTGIAGGGVANTHRIHPMNLRSHNKP